MSDAQIKARKVKLTPAAATKLLQWTSGGPRREPFPQIHGLAGTDQQEAAA